MAFVITQRCCNDASCVAACPVDCIRPTPDDPTFATSEMLHIDPGACVNCGACVPVCPTNAIRYDLDLTETTQRYADINAAYFARYPLVADPARWDPQQHRPPPVLGRLRVAIVGAGAAACYAAEELLDRADVEVNIFEKLPTPYGLIRGAVAPDHADTKSVSAILGPRFTNDAVTLNLNVDVGTHVTVEELLRHHHAVLVAVGAFEERSLAIPGEGLAGSHSAGEFVGWYNGHPGFSDSRFDLSGPRAVVVGNGNVALDIARILLRDADDLAHTDIADDALAALRESAVREVVILGRRGPTQAAYSSTELLAFKDLEGIDVIVDPGDLVTDGVTWQQVDEHRLDPRAALKRDLLDEFARAPSDPSRKRVVLRYCVSPTEILGRDHVAGIRLVRNDLVESDGIVMAVPTSEMEDIEASLVVRSAGFLGHPLAGLPFAERRGIVPNDRGRVTSPNGSVVPGVYVAGWIKRGATGTIGVNKYCARETVDRMLEDFTSGRLASPEADGTALAQLLADRQPEAISKNGWWAIDRAERGRGASQGRPRVKLTTRDELIKAAGVC